MNLKTSLKSKLGLMLVALGLGSILYFSSTGYCQDITLTMPIEDAKQLTIIVEKTKLYEKQIINMERGTEELMKQNQLLTEQITLYKEQLQLKQDQFDLAQTETENMKKMYEAKVQSYEDTKPSFLQKISTMIGSAGVGALIMAAVLLL